MLGLSKSLNIPKLSYFQHFITGGKNLPHRPEKKYGSYFCSSFAVFVEFW